MRSLAISPRLWLKNPVPPSFIINATARAGSVIENCTLWPVTFFRGMGETLYNVLAMLLHCHRLNARAIWWRSELLSRVDVSQWLKCAWQKGAMMGRAQTALAFLVLLGTCTAGALHAPLWAPLAGACSLTLLSLMNQRLAPLPQWRGVTDPVLVVSSVLNAAAAASATYIFGWLARWVWGL